MAEYTREDIIIFSDDPRAQEAIGKKCYFADSANLVLKHANDNEYCGILNNIEERFSKPFTDGLRKGWTFIIVKKEDPKPELVPFKSPEEFIEAWYSTRVLLFRPVENVGSSIDGLSIWLKNFTDSCDKASFKTVTEIWEEGVVLSSDCDITTWGDLLKSCQFVNGTPCGKLMEENNG